MPKLTKIVDGWAAHGDGWAIHGPTKKVTLEKFKEREEFHKELMKRPPWYRNPDNPNRMSLAELHSLRKGIFGSYEET